MAGGDTGVVHKMAATRKAALALYANIFRLHRRLPAQMRALGDTYVR